MKIRIAKWGNSLGVRLPKALAQETGLKEGQVVDLTARGGVVELRPAKPVARYRLEDLIAEIKRQGPESAPESVDWGPDVGAETIDDTYSRGAVRRDDTEAGKNAPRRR